MREAAVDAVLVLQDVDLYYFTGTVQSGMLCLPAEGEPLYFVQKSLTRARSESPWDRLLPFPGFKNVPVRLKDEGMRELRRVGIELDVLPAAYFLRLQEAFPGVQFVDASEAICRVRMIKSSYEIERIRRAAHMLRVAFEQIPRWIKPGVTELELMVRLEGLLRSQGHQGITRMRSFNNVLTYGSLSSGASGAYPTSFPGPVGFVGLYAAVPSGASRRKLAIGEPLMADVVGGYDGYIADKSRTFVMGELPRDLETAHQFVLDLNREIESLLLPGTLSSRIYQHALERVKNSPYADGYMGAGDSQVRFLGHGVGLELDELPVLAGGFDIPLEPGMTIAIEPKIIFPGRGAVGIENTYLITGSGFEKLTVHPEGIISVPVML
jgi:Xaa-Pro aminopeptidase